MPSGLALQPEEANLSAAEVSGAPNCADQPPATIKPVASPMYTVVSGPAHTLGDNGSHPAACSSRSGYARRCADPDVAVMLLFCFSWGARASYGSLRTGNKGPGTRHHAQQPPISEP